MWRLSFQTPHAAWEAYAAVVLQEVREADGLALVQFFMQLAAWEAEVAIRADNPLDPTMSVAQGNPWREQFLALQRPLSDARRILRGPAYDSQLGGPDPPE